VNNTVTVTQSRYSDLLAKCQVEPSWQQTIDSIARTIINNRAIYKEVEAATGVPWAFIGALHYRESSNNFKTHLHNGDPLSDRTKHVPAGRPAEGDPPFTWSESAIDALELEGFDGKTDWTMDTICERAEIYNGLGYRRMGKPSPYLWSGTNNYVRGKYISDGEYSPNTVDKQAGVIPVYLRTMELAHETTIRQNSRKLTVMNYVRRGIQALIAVVGGLWSTDTIGIIQQGAAISLTLVVVGILAWIFINWLDKLMMQDAKSGNYIPSGLADPTAKSTPLSPEEPTFNTPAAPVEVTPNVTASV
jgi:lysozyme family protein